MSTLEFNEMLVSNTDFLKPFAFTLTRDNETAKDLLQETLYRAIANRDKYHVGTNIKAWLYTIMRNIFINNYRRMVKRNTFLDATDNSYYLDSVSHSTGNDGENSFLAAEIEKALVQLPFELRESFLMNFRGYKYQEIADFFQIPIGTVKTRIHLARKILKKKLSVHGWNNEEPAGV